MFKNKAKEKREEKARQRALRSTDHGRAKLALNAGEQFFQMQRVVSSTRGQLWLGTLTDKTDEAARSTMLERLLRDLSGAEEDLPITQALAVVEWLGWRLVHMACAYRQTSAESRDFFLASGQQVAMSGEVVVIYLFRRA